MEFAIATRDRVAARLALDTGRAVGMPNDMLGIHRKKVQPNPAQSNPAQPNPAQPSPARLSPLLTTAHHHSPLLTAAHHCSPLLTTAHRCSPPLTTTQHCSPLLTTAHHCSPLLTTAHHRSPLQFDDAMTKLAKRKEVADRARATRKMKEGDHTTHPLRPICLFILLAEIMYTS